MSDVDDDNVNDAQDRAACEQLTLHEAGHAVTAVVLRFAVRYVAIRANRYAEWEGETNATSAEVRADHDADSRWRAAIVALAGREARRLKYPAVDAEWRLQDDSDVVYTRKVMHASRDTAEAICGPVLEEARRLLAKHRSAVDAVSNLLLANGFPTVVEGSAVHALVEHWNATGARA